MSVVPIRVYVQHLKDESCCQLKVMISQVMGDMKYHPFSTRWQEGFCFYIVDEKLPNIIQILYVDKLQTFQAQGNRKFVESCRITLT